MHLAAGNEQIEMACALIRAGADPRAVDADGRKPFQYFKLKENREKAQDCANTTYKDGKSFAEIHKQRQDSATEISLSIRMAKYME